MNKRSFLVAAAAALTFTGSLCAERAPDVRKLLTEMEARYAGITTYRARLLRQTRDGSALAPEETVEMTFQKPQTMRLMWVDGPRSGQDVVVTDGRLRGHRGGLLGFLLFSLPSDDPRILKETGRQLADVGIAATIEWIRQGLTESVDGRPAMKASSGYETWNEKRCIRLEMTSTPAAPDSCCARYAVYVDPTSVLPVALFAYDGADQLYERIEYRELAVDVDLPPEAFVIARPAISQAAGQRK